MKKLSIVVLSIFMIFALFTGCNNEVPAPEGMGTPAYTENLESNGAFKVGDKSYETLDLAVKAIVAAKQTLDEKVIVLTRDVTGRGATIPAVEGAAILLNLDGHKYTFTDNAIVVGEDAYFGIINGEISIYSKNAQFSAIAAVDSKGVEIKDLTISIAEGQLAIDVNGADDLYIEKVTVNSGSSKGSDQSTVVAINNVDEVEVTASEINGAVFASGNSKLSIADSEINGTVLASASVLTIGEYVDVDVVLADATQLIVDDGGHVTLVGCEGEISTIVCQNGDSAVTIGPGVDSNKYKITEARWAIGSTYYGSLNEAAAAAEDRATITAVFDQSGKEPEEDATITGKTLTIDLDNKPQKVDIILDGSNVAVENGALSSNVTGTGNITFDKVAFTDSSSTDDAVKITGSLTVYDSTIGGSVDVTGNLTVDSNGEAITPISGNITVGGNMYAEGSNTNTFGAAKTVVNGDLSLVGKNSFSGTVKVSGALNYVTDTVTTFTGSVELAGSSDYVIEEGKFSAGLVYSGTGSLKVDYKVKDENNYIKNFEDTDADDDGVTLINGVFKLNETSEIATDYYLKNVVSNIGSQDLADDDSVVIILLSDVTLTADLDFKSNIVRIQDSGVANTSCPVINANGHDFTMADAMVSISGVELSDTPETDSKFVANDGVLYVENGATLKIQITHDVTEEGAYVLLNAAKATKSIYAEDVVVGFSTIGTANTNTSDVVVIDASDLVTIVRSAIYVSTITADTVNVNAFDTGTTFTTGNLGAINATDVTIKYATVYASSISAQTVSISNEGTSVTFTGSGIVVGDAGTVTVSDANVAFNSNASFVKVGAAGAVTVSDGATVTFNGDESGIDVGAIGTVTVSGATVTFNGDGSGIVVDGAGKVTVKTGAVVENDNNTNGCGIKVGKAGTVTVDGASVFFAGYSGIVIDNGGSFTAKNAHIAGYVIGDFIFDSVNTTVTPDFSKFFDVEVTDSYFVGTIGNAYGEVTSSDENAVVNLNLTSDASARAVDSGNFESVTMKLGLSNGIGFNASITEPLSIDTLTLSSGTKNTVCAGTIKNLVVSDGGQVKIGVANNPAPSITKSLVVDQNGIVEVNLGTVTAMSVGLNGAVTINGGTFYDVAATTTTDYVPCVLITRNAQVDINAGVFNGKFVIDEDSNAVVNIYGGTFNKEFQRRSGLVSKVNVYGGTFNKDIYFGGSYTNFKISRATENVKTVIYIGDSGRTDDEFNYVCDELDYIIMAMPEPYAGKEVEVYLKSNVAFDDGICRIIDEGKKIKISSELTSSPVVKLNGLGVDDAGTEVKISNIKLVPYSNTDLNSGLVVDPGASVVLNNVVIGNSDPEAPKYYDDRALLLDGSDTVPATVSATNCTFYGNIDSDWSNIAFSGSALLRGTLTIYNSTIELTGVADEEKTFTFDVKATPSAEHPNTIEAGKFTMAKFKTGDHAFITGGSFNPGRNKGQLLAYEGAYLTVNGASVVMEDFCGWDSTLTTPTYYPGVLANVYLVNGIFSVTDEDCFKSVANNIKYVNSKTDVTEADSVFIAVVPSAAVTLSDVIVTNTGKGTVVGKTYLLFDASGNATVTLNATAVGKSYYDCESVVFDTSYGNYQISGPVGFGGHWNTTGSDWEAGSKNVLVHARVTDGSGSDSFVVGSASNAFFFDLRFFGETAGKGHTYGAALYGGTYYIDGAENAVLAKFNELNSKPRIVTGITIALADDIDFSGYGDLNLDNLWNYSLTSYGSTRKNITLGEHSVVVDITGTASPKFSELNIGGNKTLFQIKGKNTSINTVLRVENCNLTSTEATAGAYTTDKYAAFEFLAGYTGTTPTDTSAAYNKVLLSYDYVTLISNPENPDDKTKYRALAMFDAIDYDTSSAGYEYYANYNSVELHVVDRVMTNAEIEYDPARVYVATNNTVTGY